MKRNAIAIGVALSFFALVAIAFSMVIVVASAAFYVVLAAIALGILYVGTGGRAWFGSTEHPERVLGRTIRFRDVDNLGPNPADWPLGELRDFKDERYHVVFREPFMIEGREVRSAIISARHAGYPISRIRRRGLFAVAGELNTGHQFLAGANILPDDAAKKGASIG